MAAARTEIAASREGRLCFSGRCEPDRDWQRGQHSLEDGEEGEGGAEAGQDGDGAGGEGGDRGEAGAADEERVEDEVAEPELDSVPLVHQPGDGLVPLLGRLDEHFERPAGGEHLPGGE